LQLAVFPAQKIRNRNYCVCIKLYSLSWELWNGICLIPIGSLIWSLITRGELALFNLEIKKKSGSSIDLDIHYSKVYSSEQSLLFKKFQKMNNILRYWSFFSIQEKFSVFHLIRVVFFPKSLEILQKFN